MTRLNLSEVIRGLSLGVGKSLQVRQRRGLIWHQCVARAPQRAVGERAVEAFDDGANLAVPDFKDMDVSLIVALTG